MIERGEMQPDDPVEKYLPPSVKMPTYRGKQITLRHLAKETSGLRPSRGVKTEKALCCCCVRGRGAPLVQAMEFAVSR